MIRITKEQIDDHFLDLHEKLGRAFASGNLSAINDVCSKIVSRSSIAIGVTMHALAATLSGTIAMSFKRLPPGNKIEITLSYEGKLGRFHVCAPTMEQAWDALIEGIAEKRI